MNFAVHGPYLMVAALLFTAGARSQNADVAAAAATTTNVVADSPYATIIARNMFGLLPIPPPDPDAGKPPPEEPPAITLNGIMTIFGKQQALFKVANKPKPGQPPKESSYVLAEGEREDDITVLKINHVDGIVTFDNHGQKKELALMTAKGGGPTGGAGGGPGPGVGARPGAFGQPGAGGRAFPGRPPFPNAGAGVNNGNNVGNPNAAMGVGGGPESAAGNGGISMLGGTPVNANRVYQPMDDSTITPEQSVLLIEAQRMKELQNGNSGMANLLPTTPLTEQNVRENGPGVPIPPR